MESMSEARGKHGVFRGGLFMDARQVAVRHALRPPLFAAVPGSRLNDSVAGGFMVERVRFAATFDRSSRNMEVFSVERRRDRPPCPSNGGAERIVGERWG